MQPQATTMQPGMKQQMMDPVGHPQEGKPQVDVVGHSSGGNHKKQKKHKKNESPVEANNTSAPFSIGKYEPVDDNWVAKNTHDIFTGVFKGHNCDG